MIEIYLAIVIYTGLVIWLSLEGSKRKTGWLKAMLVSLFLTPIVGSILVFNSEKPISYFELHYKCARCKYEFTQQLSHCPLCEKDGVKVELEEVQKVMT